MALRRVPKGERIQNCQNDGDALDLTASCARLRDKVSVIVGLKPIEEAKKQVGFTYRRGTSIDGEDTQRIPMRLVCVIDISHSMEESYGPDENLSKLDKIKLFAQLLVRSMNEEDYLSIVSFGTNAKVVFPLNRMSEDEKEAAIIAIEEIALGGVTNLGAGICTAVEQFKTPFAKSRMHNDNILLFTDGMANEGIIESEDLIKELNKKIAIVRKECSYPVDYNIKMATLGTGGFLPELIYDLSQRFSSDAFYFLDENTSLELNLIKPILLRQAAMVSAVQVSVTAVNGVLLDKAMMSNEYEVKSPDVDNAGDNSKALYFIHDIATDMTRHLVFYLQLPNKHKKALKNKDVLTIQVKFRDSMMQVRSLEHKIAYSEIPPKELKTSEQQLITASEHEVRLIAQQGLNKAASYIKKLNRSRAKECIKLASDAIRDLSEYLTTLANVGEENQESFSHQVEPVLANLDYCERFMGDLSIRWDDVWARLKAMSSCLGREVPTADGVFVEGTEPFQPRQVDERIDNLAALLREIYAMKGLSTEMIDNYRTVMRELQDKLEKLQCEAEEDEEEDCKETRI